MWTQSYQQVKNVIKNVYFCFPSAPLYLGVVSLATWHLFTVIYPHFRLQIPCSLSNHLHGLAITPIRKVFLLFLAAFVIAAILQKRIPRRISQNRQEAGHAIPTLRISSAPHWDINLKAQGISASMRSIWTSSESQAILASLQRTSDLQELRGDPNHDRWESQPAQDRDLL